jgi:transketolase
MTTAAGSGHPGGSLSATDIMTTLFFSGLMRYRPDDPSWPARDRFILSKGHVAPVLYATMARAGYFSVDELMTLRQFDSRLQGHPDMRKLPGIEVSTGSLGQGLSIASGLAYALLTDDLLITNQQVRGSSDSDSDDRNDSSALGSGCSARPAENGAPGLADRQRPRVITLLGDGECQEGQVWEAAMFAGYRRLRNLLGIVDNNGLQIDGALSDVLDTGNIASKFADFAWSVNEVDGHDLLALYEAISAALSSDYPGPQLIVAKTIKGKGVSFMEGQAEWHGKALSESQLTEALAQLAVTENEAGTELKGARP